MKPQSAFERLNNNFRNSVTIRLISIGILVLLLLIPTSMIKDLIREREYRRQDVIDEVSQKWGKEQSICGPVLTVPYKNYFKNDDDKVIETTEYAHFLPEIIVVNGSLETELRHRSIYEVVVYHSDLQIKGRFPMPNFYEWEISPDFILWENAFVSVGISDMRAIKENVDLKWADSQHSFNPGIETNDIIKSGVSTRVPISEDDRELQGFDFLFDLKIRGSKELSFVPLGKETRVHIESAWANPSFNGAFLPNKPLVGDTGFVANWKVLHLNRNFPQQWLGSRYQTQNAAFGVNLLLPVDHYQKNMRSAKYSIMLIALSFLIFFFVEVMNKKRIHPIQYILVGLALIVFYSLLLAFSEHISFNLSYLIAAVATIALVTLYSVSIFKSKKLTFLMGGVLSVLYGFIFVILQLQDYALLMGSIGLFLVLTVVMYLSRKIDWYSVVSQASENQD